MMAPPHSDPIEELRMALATIERARGREIRRALARQCKALLQQIADSMCASGAVLQSLPNDPEAWLNRHAALIARLERAEASDVPNSEWITLAREIRELLDLLNPQPASPPRGEFWK
jgi:hypothetical protein